MKRIDITGQKFGEWTVLEYTGNQRYRCVCSCGKEFNTSRINIVKGVSKKCKECRRGELRKKRFISRVGEKHNKWTITSQTSSIDGTAICECGLEYRINIKNIVKGYSKSCKICGNVKYGEVDGVVVGLYSEYKQGAEKRGYSFSLTKEEFESFLFQDCHYCSKKADEEPVSFRHGGRHKKPIYYNGIDRINNLDGYSIENCVTCCFVCNRAKNSMPYDLYTQWVNRIKCNTN